MIGGYLLDKTIPELNNKKLILSDTLYECFKHFYINEIRYIYTDVMSKGSLKCTLDILKFSSANEGMLKHNANDEKLLEADISSHDSHTVYWSSNKFVELQVKALPWGYKEKEPTDASGNEKRHMIISPIRPMYSDEELIKSVLKGKEDQLGEFKKLVMENKNFTYLVNWVYSHQLIENKFSKEVIKNKYEEFLEDWFNRKIKN